MNLMVILLVAGLIVGGINGDGVGVHALPASSSAETFIHSSFVHSSWFGFLLESISSSILSSNRRGDTWCPKLFYPSHFRISDSGGRHVLRLTKSEIA